MIWKILVLEGGASPMDILILCLIIGFFALSWRFVLACKEIEK